MIRDYSMTIPAGGQVTRQIAGSYIALLRSDIDGQIIRVNAVDSHGQTVADVGLYQGEKIPQTGRPFVQVHFSNPGAAGVTVTVVAGEGEYQSDRMSGVVSISGTVDVDPEPKSNYPMFGQGAKLTGGVGKYAYWAFCNPVGSGMDMHMKYLRIGTDTAGVKVLARIELNSNLSAPTTGTLALTLTSDEVVSASGFKQSVGLASDFDTNFTRDKAATLLRVDGFRDELRMQRPVIIKEGLILAVYNDTANTDFDVYGIWEERPNV